MTAIAMMVCAKHAAMMNHALPGSELGKMLGRQQKAFNSVKPPRPMKFKGESVSGMKPPGKTSV